jgi:predicted TIM-barrel fold metal-dependent hydrolase
MNFQIVHAGLAFVEDTIMLADRYANVYINLDFTTCLARIAPERFAHLIGSALRQGSAHKLIFASGCIFTHPRPLLEDIVAFEIPERLMEGYGYPRWTREDKMMMLGGNIARLHNLDLQKIRGEIAGDVFARMKDAHGGLLPPWSHTRSSVGARA